MIVIFLHVRKKYMPKKDEIVKKFEEQKDDITLLDAFLYSLFSVKDIYNSIPHDRKKIINISLILFGVAMLFLYMQVGNFISILSSLVIIAAAALILIRVMTMEREERTKLQNELEVAREMQMSLMPREQPDFHKHDIYGVCKPAKDVGGDFFDFNSINVNKLAVSLADVSGKGLDAAMTTLFISGALASEIKHSDNCSEILDNLNKITMKHTIKGKFIAFLLSILDNNEKMFYYINAGQPKPVIKRDNYVFSINSQGARLPLGVISKPDYCTNKFEVKAGDILIMYTDGVNEAMNVQNEIFSTERLEKFLMTLDTTLMSSKEIAMSIIDDIAIYCGEKEQHDDIAMVVIKINS